MYIIVTNQFVCVHCVEQRLDWVRDGAIVMCVYIEVHTHEIVEAIFIFVFKIFVIVIVR